MAKGQDAAGLFPTSLEEQRLNVDDGDRLSPQAMAEIASAARWDAKRRVDPPVHQPASACELAFRHRDWGHDRQRVISAMTASQQSPSRIQRVKECGANCTMEIAADGSRVRMSARYCGDRFCVPCCNARARVVCDNIVNWIGIERPLLICLTLRSRDEGCRELIDHLKASFRRLRQQKIWSRNIRGGVSAMEITRGRKKDRWHVHMHIIALGGFIRQRELSEAWAIASRGSVICDIRRWDGQIKAIRYAAAYASKGWALVCLEREEWIVELLPALKRKRLIETFGCWRGRELETPPPDDTRWIKIGRIDDVWRLAIAGDERMATLLSAMGIIAAGEVGRPIFGRLDRGGRPPPADAKLRAGVPIPRDHGTAEERSQA